MLPLHQLKFMDYAGIEPATYWLQTSRSANVANNPISNPGIEPDLRDLQSPVLPLHQLEQIFQLTLKSSSSFGLDFVYERRGRFSRRENL